MIAPTFAFLLATPPPAGAITTDIYAEGFDTCDNTIWNDTTNTYLSEWWHSYSSTPTPMYAIGFYLGGGNGSYVGCVPPSNAPSRLQYAWGIDWTVESLFYGYQMEYPTCQNKIDYPYQIGNTPATAALDGQTAANNAAAAAQADGFNYGATIYFDLEQVLNNTVSP